MPSHLEPWSGGSEAASSGKEPTASSTEPRGEGPLPVDTPITTRCTFEGCHRTTSDRHAPGWSFLTDFAPGIKDGLYCPQHVAALEALNMSGELDADLDDEEPPDDEEAGSGISHNAQAKAV